MPVRFLHLDPWPNDPVWFSTVVADLPDVSTCLAAVGEYAVGLYAPREKRTRDQVREFMDDKMAVVAWHAHLPEDFANAARLIGAAIHRSAAKPSLPDGLIAACACGWDALSGPKMKRICCHGLPRLQPSQRS